MLKLVVLAAACGAIAAQFQTSITNQQFAEQMVFLMKVNTAGDTSESFISSQNILTNAGLTASSTLTSDAMRQIYYALQPYAFSDLPESSVQEFVDYTDLLAAYHSNSVKFDIFIAHQAAFYLMFELFPTCGASTASAPFGVQGTRPLQLGDLFDYLTAGKTSLPNPPSYFRNAHPGLKQKLAKAYYVMKTFPEAWYRVSRYSYLDDRIQSVDAVPFLATLKTRYSSFTGCANNLYTPGTISENTGGDGDGGYFYDGEVQLGGYTNEQLAQQLVTLMECPTNGMTPAAWVTKYKILAGTKGDTALTSSAASTTSSFKQLHKTLLPYCFSTASLSGLSPQSTPQLQVSQTVQQNSNPTPFPPHAVGHMVMVNYFPRCFGAGGGGDGANGGVVYDVPEGEAGVRPLHLIDLVGFITYKDPQISTQPPPESFYQKYPWTKDGPPVGDIPAATAVKFVIDHYPLAWQHLSTYNGYHERIAFYHVVPFSIALNQHYSSYSGCNTPSSQGSFEGNSKSSNDGGHSSSSNSGYLAWAITATALLCLTVAAAAVVTFRTRRAALEREAEMNQSLL